MNRSCDTPKEDGHSDLFSQGKCSWLFLVKEFTLLNSLRKECVEELGGLLINVVDDAQGDQQEEELGAFGGNPTIDLTEKVDLNFSVLGDELLSLNLS